MEETRFLQPDIEWRKGCKRKIANASFPDNFATL